MWFKDMLKGGCTVYCAVLLPHGQANFTLIYKPTSEGGKDTSLVVYEGSLLKILPRSLSPWLSRAYKHPYNGVSGKGGGGPGFPPEGRADLYSPAYSLDQPRSESAMGTQNFPRFYARFRNDIKNSTTVCSL
jgi:hypothetical protein